MIISIAVKYCELVQDEKKFVLFGVEVGTVYSNVVLKKRYEDFERFHRELSYFWNEKQGDDELLRLIPVLPKYSFEIERVRQDFSEYVGKILQILQNAKFHKYHPWIKLINLFFAIRGIAAHEEVQALLIQKTFQKYLKRKKTRSGLRINDLPKKTLQIILFYLDKLSFFQIQSTCKLFFQHSRIIKTLKIISFPTFQSNFLVKLDFSECDLINTQILRSISQNCNGDLLKELKINSCKYVNDVGIYELSRKYLKKFGKTKGGARGLEVLSVAYCKIGDLSGRYLKKFEKLKKLDIYGCDIGENTVIQLENTLKALEYLKFSEFLMMNRVVSSLYQGNIGVGCYTLNANKLFSRTLTGNPFVGLKIVEVNGKGKDFHVKINNSTVGIDVIRFLQKKIGGNKDIILKKRGKPIGLLENLENFIGKFGIQYEITSKNWLDLPKWVDRNKMSFCTSCKNVFKWYNSKLNCYKCGQVICKSCISEKIFIPEYGYTVKKVPICKSCTSRRTYFFSNKT